MNKQILTTLIAVLGVIATPGLANSAETAPGETPPQGQEAQENPSAEPGASAEPSASTEAAPEDMAARKEAFFAEMQKCDALQGVAEKQQCVDATRKRFGQM